MKCTFIDKNTVKIEYSLEWSPMLPRIESRVSMDKHNLISKFCEENPDYDIVKTDGPNMICNFKSADDAKGTWILTVSKKTKPKVNKKTKKVGV